jgi:hypothetical protein
MRQWRPARCCGHPAGVEFEPMGLGMGCGGLGFGMEPLLWVGEIRCGARVGPPLGSLAASDEWADVGSGSAPVLGCSSGQGWGGSRAGVVAEIAAREPAPPGFGMEPQDVDGAVRAGLSPQLTWCQIAFVQRAARARPARPSGTQVARTATQLHACNGNSCLDNRHGIASPPHCRPCRR